MSTVEGIPAEVELALGDTVLDMLVVVGLAGFVVRRAEQLKRSERHPRHSKFKLT